MTESDQVELQVPADHSYVGMLRTLTAGLAARCDLTLDQIEDLRIAVDEACALLLPHALPGSTLAAHFELGPGVLDVTASVSAADGAVPDRDGFAWTVLSALADRVQVDAGDDRLSIALSKQREVASS